MSSPFTDRVNRKVATIAMLSLLAAAVWFVLRFRFVSWDFRNNLWAPAYLLVRGQNPFIIEQFCRGCNAIWLPTTLGWSFPMGWLDQNVAANLWLLLDILALAAIVWLAARPARPSLARFALALGLSFLSPITISHLIMGQFTIFFALAALAAASPPGLFPKGSGRELFAGCVLALTMAKPQLAVLVLPGLLCYFGRSSGRQAMTFLAAGAVTLIGLTIPLWIAFPQWPAAFAQAVGRNPAWIQPTILWMLRDWLGVWGWGIWAVVATGAFALNLYLWRTRPPGEAISWSLGLTALVSPYLWSYDFALLIPLLAQSLYRWRSVSLRLVLAFGWLLIGGLMLWIRLNSDNSDHRYWWMPWVMMGLVWAGALVNRHTAERTG